MSIVFLAQRLENPQERVAIKILTPSDVAMADEFVSFQARFLREAQAAHQLHHEHIPPVLGYGEEDGLFYMLMPNTKVNWRAAIVGGLVGGLLLHLNNVINVLYVSRVVSNFKIYGSLGLVIHRWAPCSRRVQGTGYGGLGGNGNRSFAALRMTREGPLGMGQAPAEG